VPNDDDDDEKYVPVRRGLSLFGKTRIHKINKINYVNLYRDLYLVRVV